VAGYSGDTDRKEPYQLGKPSLSLIEISGAKGLCCIPNLSLEVRQGRMTNASIRLQELRRKIYIKAKTDKH